MKKITLYLLLIYGLSAHAQMTVGVSETPAELVENVLVGEGVTPFNIIFNGAPANQIRFQTGHFVTNFNQTNLGIGEGLIMSTGDSREAVGPNDSGGNTSTGGNLQINDVDLDILTTNNVRNVTVIEFDFVATGLELNFDYVFASEEYPEYVYDTNGYNDIFGFFLRGPGITGPFTGNAKNIAVVPNTTIPITVNTINNGHLNTGQNTANPLLYNNNTTIGQNPTTFVGPTVQYDGFTDVLRATSELICGETYHIKLAIANCGDTAFDSAVFLKNFRIKPLELADELDNFEGEVARCHDDIVTINSDIVQGTNIFTWAVNTTYDPSNPTAYDPSAFTVLTDVVTGAPINTPSITVTASPTAAVPPVDEYYVYSLVVNTSYGCQIAADELIIRFRPPLFEDVVIAPVGICEPSLPPYNNSLTVNIDRNPIILQDVLPADYINYDIWYYDAAVTSYQDAADGVPAGILSPSTFATYPITQPITTIYIRVQEAFDEPYCTKIFPLVINVTTEASGSFSYPASPFCAQTVLGAIVKDVTPGGTYSATPSGLDIDVNTGEVHPNTSVPGNYEVDYLLPAYGACPAFTVLDIPVSVISTPAAPGVTNIIACEGETVSLSASGLPGASYLWYDAAIGGTGSATPPSVNTSAPAFFQYYVSQTIGPGCESVRSLITVTVNDVLAAPAVSAAPHYCKDTASAAIAPITDLVTATGILLWYDNPADITGDPIAPVISSAVQGTITYYVTQMQNNCESPRARVDVVIDPLPSAPGVTNPTVIYCLGSNAPVLSATGNNLLWYNSATSVVGNTLAPTPNTGSAGDTIYYVSQTLNGCEGPRTAITVTVAPIPNAPSLTILQPSCTDIYATIIVTAPSGLNLEYSIDNGVSYQALNSFDHVGAGITYQVVVRNTLTGCVSAASPAVVDPEKLVPSMPMASTTVQPNCNTTTGTIEVTAPLGANLVYTIDGGLTYQPQTTFDGLTPNTNYTVVAKDIVNDCTSPGMIVHVDAIPSNPNPPTANVTQPTCTTPTGTIELTGPLGADLEYSIDGGTTYQPQLLFANLGDNATYTVTVHNTTTGCFATASFAINVAPTFPATPVANGADVCVNETISLSTPAVAGAGYSWTGPDGFSSSDQNPTIANAEVTMSGVYSVVISTTADCPSNPGSVTIMVNPLPQPTLEQDGYICFNTITNTGDTYELNAGLDDANYDFEWFTNSGGTFVPIPLETNNIYEVSVPGSYAVQATNTATGCVSPMVTATVQISSPPLQVIAIGSEYFNDNQAITINVSPPGNYEYQLDNGAFQSSNTFTNLLSGDHQIKVRNECGEMTGSSYLLDYPKFFTPNGDNYNDAWNIFALCSQANAKIYIFDRYGKLLKQISPCGAGWDGTMNDRALPSTDYWFTVEYEENNVRKEYKSHFALKR